MHTPRSTSPWWVPTLVAALAAAPALAGTPRLEALEPTVVAPHSAFTLALVGSGFEDGAIVKIEAGTAGRYLTYHPSSLSGERCEVTMPLGFGPRPAERHVYLANPGGESSERLTLAIGSPAETTEPAAAAEPGSPAAETSAPGETPEGSPTAALPLIRELAPPSLAAGRATVLEVYGENFEEGSTVWITANLNAGSSRLPEYGLRAFDTAFVDPELLEVELDRGFFPVPGVRDVVVENSGGVRSMAATLTIRQEEE